MILLKLMLNTKKILNIFKKKSGIFASFDNKNLIVAILLALTVLLGAWARLHDLGKKTLVADEFLDMNSSFAYHETGIWQAWDFNLNAVDTRDVYAPRDERAWIYKWQVAKVFDFLIPTEEVARSVSVFWGLVSIILTYFLTVSYTGSRRIGLLVAFLIAISPMAITFSRKLRMYAMFYPVYMILSWLLFKFYEKRYKGKKMLLKFFDSKIGVNMQFGLPLAIVAALSLHLHLLTLNIALVFFFYVLVQAILNFRKEKAIFNNKYAIHLSLMVFLVAIAAAVSPKFIGAFNGSFKFFMDNTEYFTMIMRDYSSAFWVVFFGISGFVYLYFFENKKKESVWLAVSLLVPLFLAAFTWRRVQGSQYIFFVHSFLVTLISSGIYATALFFKKNLNFHPKRFFAVCILLSLLLLPDYSYFSNKESEYVASESDNYREGFKFVRKKLVEGDVIITRNFRNYYLSGANVKVYDFGGERAERKVSVEELTRIMETDRHGWVIFFDNDRLFFNKEARDYVENNLKKVEDKKLKGDMEIYTWGK
ncbi:MAG: hypothetical protein UY41_C0038G0004 [Candidatus Moranbacteria bacterium GW2011_GWE1_49_15]|nr:MAG: hypothetical protein UY41_C0038G0004 [Candidatus Moranbacteria bacterium GW2011_GWE1_49_15]